MTGFVKAEKRRAKLRLALDGPSGSGKTWTGLTVGTVRSPRTHRPLTQMGGAVTNQSTDLTVTKQTTELTIGSGAGLEHAYRVAKALAQSGFFKDAQQPAQAMAKIVAGVEYGIGAFAAMTQIHAIDGKLSPGATLVAALIKRSGRYRFRQVQSTDQVCTLEFFFRDDDGSWVSNGDVSFTIDEAKAAGLVGKNNWRGYPADMLFARALGRGARRFCADVFGGASTYTPDELGAVTNQSGDLDDDAIDADAVEAIIADVDTTADDAPDPVIETAEFEDVPDDDPLGGGDPVIPVWQSRWAEALERFGEYRRDAVMKDANPEILADDAVWERFCAKASEIDAVGGGVQAEEPAQDTPPPTNVINAAQLRRLHAITGEAGVGDTEASVITYQVAGVTSRKHIPVDKYDAVITAIEAAGKDKP